MQKLRSIQVLRGVAALGVVAHHAYRHVDPNTAFRLGAAGVDLFFVISGFIMATVASGKRPGQFLFDRFWRIYPMWWLALAPWLLLGSYDQGKMLASLTLWPVWGGAYHTPALLVGWTLGFEILFYLAFALALLSRPVVPILAFAACAPFTWHGGLLGFLGSPMILEFAMGVLIARSPRVKFSASLLPLGVLWLAAFPPDLYEEAFGFAGLLRVLTWGVPSALIIYSVIGFEELFRHPDWRVPVLLGNASYSIYLFHPIVVGIGPWPVGIALSVGLGLVIHLAIERRIIRAKWLLRSYLDQGTIIAGRRA